MKIIYLMWVVLLISTSLVDWTDSQITSIGLAFSPALAGIKLLGLAGLAALAGSGGNSNQGKSTINSVEYLNPDPEPTHSLLL